MKHGYIILVQNDEFYSIPLKRTLSITNIFLSVPKVVVSKDTHRRQISYHRVKLFAATGYIQAIFFLRDVLDYLDGKEIRHDNEKWENIKADKRMYRINVDEIYAQEAESL